MEEIKILKLNVVTVFILVMLLNAASCGFRTETDNSTDNSMDQLKATVGHSKDNDTTTSKSSYTMKLSYKDITKQAFDSLKIMSRNEQLIFPDWIGEIMEDELIPLFTSNKLQCMFNGSLYDSETGNYFRYMGYSATHDIHFLDKNPPGTVNHYLINADRTVYPISWGAVFLAGGNLLFCHIKRFETEESYAIEIYRVEDGVPELLVHDDIMDWGLHEAIWIDDDRIIIHKIMCDSSTIDEFDGAYPSAPEVRYCLLTLHPSD